MIANSQKKRYIGIVAVFVRIKLGSLVLFTQERPGKDGKILGFINLRQ